VRQLTGLHVGGDTTASEHHCTFVDASVETLVAAERSWPTSRRVLNGYCHGWMESWRGEIAEEKVAAKIGPAAAAGGWVVWPAWL
jgi:hypothetical protein